ncbi:MAG: cbb3-type cytochrome c oxidase subunit 3 [Gammaproteobacteria bacterium]|nr:cbb3-type cytochrome c oxidase subunit 3 [Gammaproteobacteria bacterium]
MNSIKQYFYTDWNAMTWHDWVGLIITVVVFFAMVAVFIYVFHPSNKNKLEAKRFIPMNEDRVPTEDEK